MTGFVDDEARVWINGFRSLYTFFHELYYA